MEFTNSGLVNYTKISPNKNENRNHEIDTITIHCVVGQLSVQTIGDIFAPESRQASSNYAVGYDGSIGMYVEEKDRSWCTSSRSNDHRAITIEVACDKTAPYTVNDKAYAALIELVADICKRNNIKELKWKADKSLIGQVDKQNMTVHRWFANTACPGEYLYEHMGDIADKVNVKLGVVKEEIYPMVQYGSKNEYVKKLQEYLNKLGASLDADGDFGKLTQTAVKNFQKANSLDVDGIVGPKTWAALETAIANLNAAKPSTSEIKAGDHVKLASNAVYTTGKNVPNWVKNMAWIVKKVEGEIAVIDKSVDGTHSINSPVNVKYLSVVKSEEVAPKVEEFKSYMVKVTSAALNVRSGPGVNYGINTCIRDKGSYTIVAESDGWGKLKSGAGWINLDYTKKI